MKLIPQARDVWKFYSTWAVVALGTWNMVPTILQAHIPLNINVGVSVALLVSVIIARVVPQPKLDRANED